MSKSKSREIPDLPANDYRFMVTIMVDGYGRPRQLEKEYKKAITEMLINQFGKAAELTSIVRSGRDDVVLTDGNEHT